MVETAAEQESFAYVPLSSLIILLVILLTCASRRKKNDTLSSIEKNLENNDIKEEYAVMCFPCLKKKPDSKNFEPTEDLSNQFEYIVEKYTIRKVPLLLANTVEDIIERQEELEMAKAPQSQPQLLKDDFVNFQVSQDVYNIQRIPPCITVAANAACPGKKALKERSKPSDILESMSPVTRPPVNNHNYVVIPTKGSLRHKDIMITKREITNQYLNNFSSVFVDNLKDQVPKDPEQFPSLSRPYTSAFKTFPIDNSQICKASCGKRRKGKNHKVAYAFPVEESDERDDVSVKEEPDSESGSCTDVDPEPDADNQDQTSEAPESEFQEDVEVVDSDSLGKSKSLVLLNDSDSVMDGTESVVNPFKTTIKSSASVMDDTYKSVVDAEALSHVSHKEDWPGTKNVTYEDIQALDVGYEFTSCEKLGVKPKMTRIPYPIESEKFKESLKLAFGDSSKMSKKCFSQDQPLTMKSIRTVIIKPPLERGATNYFNDFVTATSERNSLKSIDTETSFIPNHDTNSRTEMWTGSIPEQELATRPSTPSFCKSEESKGLFLQENDNMETASGTAVDSVTEISKLYDLSIPVSRRREQTKDSSETSKTNEPVLRSPRPSKSRSFQEYPVQRRESGPEVKGNDNVPYQTPNSSKKDFVRVNEPDTETSCSLYSRESKTSSVVTTGLSSEVDEGKRATLRWKIVIKHHREDDSSKKNVNMNIRH